MKKEKAIEILQTQLTKVEKINADNCYVWQTQIASYIKTFFGETSNEFQFINTVQFYFYIEGKDKETRDKIPRLKQFIENCIETISNTGLKKKEWKQVFITTHPAVFWSIFVAIIGFSFWAGTLVSNSTNKGNNASNENTQNKNESVHRTDSTDKTRSNTNKILNKPDTSIK
jgi:hypothetical protein